MQQVVVVIGVMDTSTTTTNVRKGIVVVQTTVLMMEAGTVVGDAGLHKEYEDVDVLDVLHPNSMISHVKSARCMDIPPTSVGGATRTTIMTMTPTRKVCQRCLWCLYQLVLLHRQPGQANDS